MTEMCWYFSLAEMALPWLFVAACFKRGRTFPFLQSIVRGLVVYEIFLFVTAITLGYLGMLDGLQYRVIFIVATLVALCFSCFNMSGIVSELKGIRYRPHWFDLPVAVCCLQAAHLIYIGWSNDWTGGTPGYDGMHYHIPRALQWFWHGDFRPYPTMIAEQLAFPVGGAATLLAPVFNGCGWLGGAYTTLVLSLGACVAVVLTSRTFGVGARGSLLGGLVLLSCPTVGLRIIDVSTDIAATFPVIAAVALARVVSSIEAALFIFTALVGLGGSMKQYAVFPAVPIGLALFLPHTMRILRSWRALVAGLAGIAVALLCLASSMLPIYWAYGDISGGDFAFSLSNVGRGWHGIRETLAYNFVQWSFEPLALLPEDLRRSVFTQLSLDKVWAYFGHPGSVNVLLPQVDRERMRGLAYSILFLPWLILAVKKGYRIIALVVFLAIAFAQLAPLAVNLVGARFTIIILAAFSVLWAARAARSPVIVGCIVCLTLNADIYCASRGYPFQLSWPTFQMQHEVNRDLLTAVGDDTVLLLGKAMALDAEIAGRFAQVRFEYANCPADGDWTAHFAALKSQFRWFMMSAPPSEIMPGPYFKTRLGPVCQSVMPTMLKEALSAAGWRYETKVVREYELWTHP